MLVEGLIPSYVLVILKHSKCCLGIKKKIDYLQYNIPNFVQFESSDFGEYRAFSTKLRNRNYFPLADFNDGFSKFMTAELE